MAAISRNTYRTPRRDELVESVRLLEAGLPSMLAGNVTCLIAVTVLVHGTLPAAFLWPWFGLQLTLAGWRAFTTTASRRLAADGRNTRRRLRVAVVHALLSGSCWGLFGWMAVASHDSLAALVALMTATGLLGGATAMVGHLPAVYVPYALMIVLPPVIRLLAFDDMPGLGWTGALLVLYLVFSLVASRGARRLLRQSIELRHSNESLVDRLRLEHGRTDGERRRAETALERERRANLEKSRFLSAASHDLRQPLQSLALQVATLSQRTRGTEHEGPVIAVERSLGALEALFDALLDISKLEAGTLQPERRPVTIAPLLTRLVEGLEPQARSRGLEIGVDAVDVTLLTDPVLLARLVNNLVGNALRYTPSGRVEVDARMRGATALEIRVIDSGPGIPVEARERVFDEFVQLGEPGRNSGRDQDRGMGLGLSIVRRIAGLLHLGIDIGDTPGGGTTVTIGVPADQLVTRPDASVEPEAPAAPVRETGLTVLIIDDEASVLEAMTLFLESSGCEVLAAPSGDEALARLASANRELDAIVCDYRLHDDERGPDTIRRVREHCGTPVPAILVTGDVAAERLLDIGASGLRTLHKPCDPQALLRALHEGAADTDVARSPEANASAHRA